jgi:hypothetical protein
VCVRVVMGATLAATDARATPRRSAVDIFAPADAVSTATCASRAMRLALSSHCAL